MESSATINTGTGTISLAADVNADGTGNDGLGTLTIQAGGRIYAASINLRGAGMSIAPTVMVGSSVSGNVVSTLAGSGQSGSRDGTGRAASFENPCGVAVDSAGNVYVADTDNNEIRKITPAGEVSTLAGSGQSGSRDGTGRAASFENPCGVAVDSAGNVYVADTDNNEIRKITPAGVVTTLAGSGQYGSSDGSGSAASFENPFGVAVDSAGNLYVADTYNHEIRKITPAGVVTTLAGSGQYGSSDGSGSAASFEIPFGVAVDSAGNVYVGDTGNNEIRKITSTGAVSTLAGSANQAGSSDGDGSAASFNLPTGVAVDSAGNVYVADWGNNDIRKITPAGVVSTQAGSGLIGSSDGSGSAASFRNPFGVAVDSAGNVYVADTNNSEIREITPVVATDQVTIRSSLPSRPMSIGGARATCRASTSPTPNWPKSRPPPRAP